MPDGNGSQAARAGRGGITPVRRETLHDRVYAELRRSLIHGVFVSGQMLRIQDLAEKLNTSTMPVREALARLISEQALEALPNRTVRVPVITREKLDDLARARVLIEGEVTARAMAHLNEADFVRLRHLTRQCEAAFTERNENNIRHATELNHAFHDHIYRAAASPVLQPMIESLWLQSGPYVHAAAFLHDETNDPAGTHHHWELITALEKRDATGAIAALTRDITRAFSLLRNKLDADEADARARHHG
ncbi:GntR family transcriptional regulator [Aestuariivirga litoralis]|uniref:GntR family transcriptional regulator n=1 Tax=Aestuariivirga litoralis TaxID=2650924 RepID=A0A2W2BCY5_9HYPH|nr:GntR family transcriptional regulator [Aestuariivirga litoralis]PZF78048.1 GntR family transcriptional regulator [Aestuariivirga litoralis]